MVQAILSQHNIVWDGYDTAGQGARQTHHIGFQADDQRFEASRLLARQTFPGVNRGSPIQLSLDLGCPPRNCLHCYHPDKPSRSTGHTASECPYKDSMCTICHQEDHLTSACSWQNQSTFKAPAPSSYIPVQDRISARHHPGRERQRPSKRGRRGTSGSLRGDQGASSAAAPRSATVPRSAAAVAASNDTQLKCHSQHLLETKYGSALVSNRAKTADLVCGGLDGSCIMVGTAP